MEISRRQCAVLRAVVERYVALAAPVASEVLARHDLPGVSSATIRHDLAALEEAGLIYHPHTSAGRIPSERGYRFFVEHLLPQRGLSAEERHTILHQFGQVEDEVDEWLRLASATLAAASGVAAVVSAASGDAARLRHLELVPLDSRRLLVVAITVDAAVYQHILDLDEPAPEHEPRAEAGRLSAAWADWRAADFRRALAAPGPTAGLERALQAVLAGILERHDRRQWEVRYHDGLANVLSQPEFHRAIDDQTRRQRLHGLLALVEHGDIVRELAPDVVQAGGLRVLIGEEQPQELRDLAVVLCPYGGEGGAVGVLGVIGPTRLDYRRAVDGARYVAGILSALLREWRGPAPRPGLGERAG